MPLLKFRVLYEDDDSIFRDIEIKPMQGFDDFQQVILTSYNLPASGSGFFFTSNDNWQKGRQIHPVIRKQEVKTRGKSKVETLPSIVAFIDDPHQHFIYEYHGSPEASFLIELTSIGGSAQLSAMYPVLVRSQGNSPFKKEIHTPHSSKSNVVIPDDADDDEDDDPSPFAGNDSEPDVEDLAFIEGEEGDLMDGDAIKDEVEEESAEDNFDAGDDFESDELNEEPIQDLEEEL
ncbi:MAG: hypothetical protein ABIQ74_09990 [Chitinophagales bacterium]